MEKSFDRNIRLKRSREYAGMSQEDFALKAGVSQGYVGQLETSKGFSLKAAEKFGKILGVDGKWLYFGEGQQFPGEEKPNAHLIGDLQEEEFGDGTKFKSLGGGRFIMKVPLVTEKAKAGWLQGFADPEFEIDLPTAEIVVDFYHKGHYLAFVAEGESMNNGDINEAIPDKAIITARELTPEKWAPRLYDHKYKNWVFVHKTKGILVKQIADQNISEGWLLLRSLNPDKNNYPDQKINLADVHRIYNVVQRQLP